MYRELFSLPVKLPAAEPEILGRGRRRLQRLPMPLTAEDE
jgi:hypothetical protein